MTKGRREKFKLEPDLHGPLRHLIDRYGLQDLSAAIRRGDTAEAEHQLDRLFQGNDELTWRIQSGRMGGAARKAA